METLLQPGARQPRKWTALRFLIPGIIFSFFLLNLAMRSIPPRWMGFHAWEAATLYATAEGDFAPNFHYVNDRAFGDLANMGNLRSLRHYRREVFTTDEFGFRNPPGIGVSKPPEFIVVGDSYAVGSGVSDRETLSAQLSDLTGKAAYNGATYRGNWATTKFLIDRLRMRNGLVVWEFSERWLVPESVRSETRIHSHNARLNTSEGAEFSFIPGYYRQWADDFLAYSPLNIFIDRALRRAQNGVWLPNPLSHAVVVNRLTNGDAMLFLPDEVEGFYHPHYENSAYFSEVNALIHETGNELLVVLVPDKYNAYHALLQGSSPAPQSQLHLDHLEQDLIRSNVPVLNLTSALRSQAAKGLQNREYDYFTDDTHWNQLGIHVAATEILRYRKGQ
jgi:acetyltransferase AlgX (SGNH hydrolase-like protein)